MKKFTKKLCMTILPLIIVIAIDQFTKGWARTLVAPVYWWKFKLNLVFNNGIILGTFSELPLNVKEVILTTLGTFIITSYLIGLWLLPIRSRSTYLGLSLMIGGIMGNVIDRFNGFAVVDFLTLNITSMNLPYFNMADFSQWLGYAFLLVGLYRDSLYYWPTNDYRNNFIINPSFQIRSSLLITLFTFCMGIITLVFSFTFLKNGQSQLLLHSFYTIGFAVIFAVSLFTFLVSLVLTHRVAGPVYAVQRHVENILLGKISYLKLREFDEFKELEMKLNALSEEINLLRNTDETCPPPLPANIKVKKVA
jgi:signal peptidase II